MSVKADAASVIRSGVCHLDASTGRLSYRGFDVRELAEQASFEEVALLLVRGTLPSSEALKSFAADVRHEMIPRREARKVIDLVPTGTDEMAVLRSAVSTLGLQRPGETSPDEAAMLIGQVASLVAARYRVAREMAVVRPKRGLSFAANFLHMLQGEEPDVQVARAFESALVLRADNELKPSAFAVRVAASTGADLTGCITAGLAALAGPKHGAHSVRALQMLLEIGQPARVDAWARARHDAGGNFEGFGHPVYANGDPRTPTARGLAELACERMGEPEFFQLAESVERRVQQLTGLGANIDFWLATLYRAIGIPVELFTPVFAVARTCGWIAHALEQRENPALLRPRAEYIGPESRSYLSSFQR